MDLNSHTRNNAESSSDIILQAADIELFTDNLNETFQTGRQNNPRHRRSRPKQINSSSRREEEHVTRRDADQDCESSPDTQRTAITHAIMQTTQMTQHEESQTINITFNSESGITNTQGNITT
ncbi:PREDICTED: uncharacterized protein LOC105568364 isoform X1 [Vollenhovia emeryi]|uniref:uncharacterized protein LOC105568364 isoform X1 n=1 Tax=Vollenhovia emeryi TaxID=411798 RepID=UPI0005F48A0A|nr:PREDICTED: uncharacterized protein LOC105568364 isoform X1 [Vollenhovia emeryi]